jgi:hypothetical protein
MEVSSNNFEHRCIKITERKTIYYTNVAATSIMVWVPQPVEEREREDAHTKPSQDRMHRASCTLLSIVPS